MSRAGNTPVRDKETPFFRNRLDKKAIFQIKALNLKIEHVK